MSKVWCIFHTHLLVQLIRRRSLLKPEQSKCLNSWRPHLSSSDKCSDGGGGHVHSGAHTRHILCSLWRAVKVQIKETPSW